MGELVMYLDEENEAKVKRFSNQMAVVMVILALVCFSAGVIFLRDSVFKHYYNPTRHVIVAQDPETMEIFAWKDAGGNLYTPADADVKSFPYGTMGLLLVLLVLTTQGHSLIVKNYAATLVIKSHLPVPGPLPEEVFAHGRPALAAGAGRQLRPSQAQVGWKFKIADQR